MMDWNCTRTEERLSDFLDGTLLTDETEALTAHVVGCARCAATVAQVSALVSRMQQSEPVEEPPHLAGRILDATLGPRSHNRGERRWFAWLPAIWQPRFAMGIVTVAASFLVLFRAVAPTASKADLNPADLFRAANRQAHLTYARGAKFVSDLRVVYQIQARFASEPEPSYQPMSEPLPEPAAAPHAEPPPSERPAPDSSNPRRKSQLTPRPDRRGSRGVPEFAMLSTSALLEDFLKGTPRSLP